MADRPVPLPDNVSRPYWEAAGRGELLYQECPRCGQRQLYPRALCTQCAGTPEWRTASGRGTVHTFTVIRQNWAEPFREMLPYVVAMVELDEGPRLMSNVTECSPDDVHVGMPVEAWFLPAEDGLALPMFRPVASG
jgi:uncharacterized OB-fold protein